MSLCMGVKNGCLEYRHNVRAIHVVSPIYYNFGVRLDDGLVVYWAHKTTDFGLEYLNIHHSPTSKSFTNLFQLKTCIQNYVKSKSPILLKFRKQ